MRTIFLFVTGCLLFVNCSAHPGKKEKAGRKYIPLDYTIVETKLDSTLDQQHAVFSLVFDESTSLSHHSIELSCNGVISWFEASNEPFEITVSPGSYIFQLAASTNYQEITTDSIMIEPGYRTVISFHFRNMQTEPMTLKKPVIYAYSDQELAINLTIDPLGELTFTYPQANNGHWSGTIHTDGTFSTNGKNYPYLFWEGERKQSLRPDVTSGFVVNRDEVVPFLEKQLTQMGLNAREQTDFITFWGPIMAQSENGFAHFIFNDDYAYIASLEVSPKPDHVFRVYLLWTPLESGQHISPEPQTIPHIIREGFYIVEWGGSEVLQSNQTASK